MPRRTNLALLQEDYLRWLEPQLRDEHGNPSRDYRTLIQLMFETPFTVLIEMDNNRLDDAMDLRAEFTQVSKAGRTDMLELGPCSFLEVLIGLSRRLAFVAGGEAPGWAWVLLGNLDMQRMWDPLSRAKQRKAEQIMANVIHRHYQPNGQGGFFPLSWPDEDQTNIELWYQLNAYASELHPEH